MAKPHGAEVILQQLSPVAILDPKQQQQHQQQQVSVPQTTVVFPTPVAVPALSPAMAAHVDVPTSVQQHVETGLLDRIPALVDLNKQSSSIDLPVSAERNDKMAPTPAIRPRHSSMPALDERMDTRDVTRDQAMRSPDCSETSTTPVVGDDYFERQHSLDVVVTAGGGGGSGKDVKRQKLNIDSGMGSSCNDGASETSRSKAESGEQKISAYHFKKDIKWRFTADSADRANVKDAFVDDKHDLFKEPRRSQPNSASDYGSDYSGHNSSSNDNGTGSGGSSGGQLADCSSVSTGYSSGGGGGSSACSADASLSNTVPAFALHPMGVFYIPLVLPVAQVMPFMKNHRSMGICHPISIPVSFTGPFHMGIPHAASGASAAGDVASGSGLTASDISTEFARSNKLHHRHMRHNGGGHSSSRRHHAGGDRSAHAHRDGSKRA